MDFTKQFVIGYTFFFIIINLFGFSLNIFLPTIPSDSNPVVNVLLFLPNAVIFLFNFLTFTTQYAIINIILWSVRCIGLIEILMWIRGTN